ncbi:Ovate family protein 5 [Hibiscus syriacus]|uniref:Ovate family protein 5 n=1 Tax=Hibiscus syriacus TaxID=106335 RepID=A0A6A3C9N0_HIBSY|nr:Ovate family protein 5 [Hibiscus syriacus]
MRKDRRPKMKGRVSRIGSYAIASSMKDHTHEPCITCTTFNILAPTYKRLSHKEFSVGKEELANMYEKRLGDAGYLNFKLGRTNNRGDDNRSVDCCAQGLFKSYQLQGTAFQRLWRLRCTVATRLVTPSQSRNNDPCQEILIVYKILQSLESYQKDYILNPLPVMLCGDGNGSKLGHVYKFLRSQGFVLTYDTGHRYTDADAHKWVSSHLNHRGNICGVDFIWLHNPNSYRKLLKTSWTEAVFGKFKVRSLTLFLDLPFHLIFCPNQLRKASLTEDGAFAFLKADNDAAAAVRSTFQTLPTVVQGVGDLHCANHQLINIRKIRGDRYGDLGHFRLGLRAPTTVSGGRIDGERLRGEQLKEAISSDGTENAIIVQTWSEYGRTRFRDNITATKESVWSEKVIVSVRKAYLSELLRIWTSWDNNEKVLFREVYDDIVELLRVPIDAVVVQALAECWNLSYRCFTFGIPFYTKAIRPKGFTTKMIALTGKTKEWVEEYIHDEGISWTQPKSLIYEQTPSKRRRDYFALAVYGLLVFPMKEDHFDITLIDFVEMIGGRSVSWFCIVVTSLVVDSLLDSRERLGSKRRAPIEQLESQLISIEETFQNPYNSNMFLLQRKNEALKKRKENKTLKAKIAELEVTVQRCHQQIQHLEESQPLTSPELGIALRKLRTPFRGSMKQ